jgi:hypothetical protein
MEARPASGLLVSALIRHIEAGGGHGVVVAKGDATAGAILILLSNRGEMGAILERMPTIDGYRWSDAGVADGERDVYLADRRRVDPDLWIVELDHPQVRERALEILAG